MRAMIGFLLNLQFFTAIPIRKQLPMEDIHIRRAIQTFPIVGLFQGMIYAGSLYVLNERTPMSALAAAFVLWLLTIVVTGGLHLDGWMDASDAFFSYRDINKRLEIMSDPRSGAFAVLSVIVLLACRFLFIYEITISASILSYWMIVLIPFLGRTMMGVLLTTAPLAKQEGLAYYFKKAAGKNSITIYYAYFVAVGLLVICLNETGFLVFLFLAAAALLALLFIKKKIVEWFSGITGDVLGAFVEGVEAVLWTILWLLHYSAMV